MGLEATATQRLVRRRRTMPLLAAIAVVLAAIMVILGLLYVNTPLAIDPLIAFISEKPPTATVTLLPTPTDLPTATPEPTDTPTPLPTATVVPTATSLPTATPLPPTATPRPPTPTTPPPPTFTYYGAQLNGMRIATGVGSDGAVAPGGPWPQAAGNYCSLADVQGVVNYLDWAAGRAPRFPTQASQGPPTYSTAAGNASAAQPGQLVYDLDHRAAANFAPGPQIMSGGSTRRPFTLANTSHDFGLDPRAIAAGIMYETNNATPYHQHIYRQGADSAAWHTAVAVAKYHLPVVATVNHGAHAVLIAGVWASADPSLDPRAKIESFAVFNPWDQRWGPSLGGHPFTRLPYATFVRGNAPDGSWLSQPYASNGTLDPDPYMGIYQAGNDPFSGPTSHPQASFWIGSIVTIEPDGHNDQNPDNAFNDADQLMTGP